MRQTDWHVPKLTGAHLGATTIGGNEPLSLALSPLRGAREMANPVVGSDAMRPFAVDNVMPSAMFPRWLI